MLHGIATGALMFHRVGSKEKPRAGARGFSINLSIAKAYYFAFNTTRLLELAPVAGNVQ
jgi:hypothetical protein